MRSFQQKHLSELEVIILQWLDLSLCGVVADCEFRLVLLYRICKVVVARDAISGVSECDVHHPGDAILTLSATAKLHDPNHINKVAKSYLIHNECSRYY